MDLRSPTDGASLGRTDDSLLSPSADGKKALKPGSSMPKKLVDMLGPLLVGSSRSKRSTPATPTSPSTPSGPPAPTPAAGTAQSSQGPQRTLSQSSGLLNYVNNMNLCEAFTGGNSPAKAVNSASTTTASSTSPFPSATAAVAAAAAAMPVQPQATVVNLPAGKPNVPHSMSGQGNTTTPSLDRLMHAARHCSLPPSPRVDPGQPGNQTMLLSLSPTVPPRMQRANWCLDDYMIQEKLYTGYASTVFKATCKRSAEVVVLKVYTLAAVCDLYKYQIYREVRVHGSLTHENIVQLYAAFQEGDKVIMVQEYADGSDLFTLLHKYGGRLSERLAVQMVLDPFMRVLQYLHTRAIIHRDIKPENIMFNRNMALKLGDFGLAIDLREERAVTRAGTLDYMAPEVLRCPFKSRPEENKENDRLHYGARVDSWAVGVLTYELLVGFPPFFDQSRTTTEDRIVNNQPTFPAGLSEEAMSFITKALEKNAINRPTLYEMLHHPWVEQYRTRRSMRAIPTPGSAQPAGQVQGPAQAAVQQATAAVQAAAAAAAMPVQQLAGQQGASNRKAATSTTINATQVQQALMAGVPQNQHHASQHAHHAAGLLRAVAAAAAGSPPPAPTPTAPVGMQPFPGALASILTSINEGQQAATRTPAPPVAPKAVPAAPAASKVGSTGTPSPMHASIMASVLNGGSDDAVIMVATAPPPQAPAGAANAPKQQNAAPQFR